MNDLLAGLARWMLRLLLLAMGVVFFVSLLAAALVLALLWGLRALWARVTGRSVTPWAMPIDPRAGWTTVVRRTEHWMASGRAAAPGADTPAHLRPLPGAEDVTDVQPREPGAPR